MDVSLAVWLVVALSVAAANLPFLTERVFGFIPLPPGEGPTPGGEARVKRFHVRLLELIVLYFLVGAVARLLESRIGGAFAQNWEFYAVTACLFLVLAFPGFVIRYLRKRRS
ncbi:MULTISPECIES: DUF2818 family protein [unclassified Massilia]|uniref:DUF2818 family protein n=1 Tax=unclassified Massilia TaxID=2609279 RepID=UPI001B834D4D|nr:DUF2818 family protein [Massilia sp. AB1]MBQ5962393.1 DUF2818 family protein [Massilia sp. ZL223]